MGLGPPLRAMNRSSLGSRAMTYAWGTMKRRSTKSDIRIIPIRGGRLCAMVGVRDRIPRERSGLVLRQGARLTHFTLEPHIEFTEGALVALLLEILQRNLSLLEAFLVLSRRNHAFGATKSVQPIVFNAFQGNSTLTSNIAPRSRGYIAKHSS